MARKKLPKSSSKRSVELRHSSHADPYEPTAREWEKINAHFSDYVGIPAFRRDDPQITRRAEISRRAARTQERARQLAIRLQAKREEEYRTMQEGIVPLRPDDPIHRKPPADPCQRRKARREVLHAMGKTGKKGARFPGRKRASRVKC